MTNIIKDLAPRIWESIQKSQNILLHCHPSPDGDSIGGVLAMGHMLQAINKQVTIIGGDSKKPTSLSVLPGFDKIVEKSIDQINLQDFDTFIIQDSSNKDQISSKITVEFPSSLNTIIIDHHKSNPGFANINLIDASYPATCQLVFDLFKIWEMPITQEVAVCLLVGIYTDTGGYKYPPTDANTLSAVAELVKIYPKFYDIIFEIENSNTPGRLKYLGLALNNIHTYFNSSVAISEVTSEMLVHAGLTQEDAEKSYVSNQLISVPGWNIGICCYEPIAGEVHISCRTRNPQKHDVSRLAVALGGGGHAAAAGARIKLPFDQAKDKILKALQLVYPDLSST